MYTLGSTLRLWKVPEKLPTIITILPMQESKGIHQSEKHLLCSMSIFDSALRY